MNTDPVKTFKKGNEVVRIYQEEEPESPREWDNLGTMLCFHREYTLGDESELKPERFQAGEKTFWQNVYDYLKNELKAVVILPLYLYDHSGLRMKVGSYDTGQLPEGHAYFDTMQVGFIYVTREKMKEEKIRTSKQAEKILRQEIKIYDQYLSGDCYGFQRMKTVKCKTCGHEEEEVIDSCWGFYGIENYKDIFNQAGLNIKQWKEVEA